MREEVSTLADAESIALLQSKPDGSCAVSTDEAVVKGKSSQAQGLTHNTEGVGSKIEYHRLGARRLPGATAKDQAETFERTIDELQKLCSFLVQKVPRGGFCDMEKEDMLK